MVLGAKPSEFTQQGYRLGAPFAMFGRLEKVIRGKIEQLGFVGTYTQEQGIHALLGSGFRSDQAMEMTVGRNILYLAKGRIVVQFLDSNEPLSCNVLIDDNGYLTVDISPAFSMRDQEDKYNPEEIEKQRPEILRILSCFTAKLDLGPLVKRLPMPEWSDDKEIVYCLREEYPSIVDGFKRIL